MAFLGHLDDCFQVHARHRLAVIMAAALGLDTYITGETSHSHYWDPAENHMNVIFAGHYATETVGVKALGAHLRDRFSLEVEFLDFPTGL